MKMNKLSTYSYIWDLKEDGLDHKRVKSVKLNFIADNMQGKINITDIQFQSGGYCTGYNPNTREFMRKLKHTVNEFAFINTVSNPVKAGVQPTKWTGVNNSIYNIVGRGHETISISNTYYDDYTEDLVPVGLDFTIIAKDDYDLLRISTNTGSYVENRTEDTYPHSGEYPLDWVYTGEYYVDGGKAGDVIEILASKHKTYRNGKDITEGKFANGIIPMSVQSYMVCCQGSNRYKIEFYKRVTETDSYGEKISYYKDTGIGFYGWAEIPIQCKMEGKI